MAPTGAQRETQTMDRFALLLIAIMALVLWLHISDVMHPRATSLVLAAVCGITFSGARS